MAKTQNYFIDQGADFTTNYLVLNPDGTGLPLAGYTFSGLIKRGYYSSNSVASISVTVVDAPNGNIQIGMAASVSANIEYGRYSYTVGMTSGGGIKTNILTGIISILPSDLEVQPVTYSP